MKKLCSKNNEKTASVTEAVFCNRILKYNEAEKPSNHEKSPAQNSGQFMLIKNKTVQSFLPKQAEA